MKFCKLAFIFLAAALFVAACANSPANPAAEKTNNAPAANSAPATNAATQSPANAAVNDEFAATREIYSQRCIRCHKETGEGGEVTIEDVTIKVPNLKDPRVAAESDAEYTKKIKKGGDGMPKFEGKLSEQEIKDLVRYMRRDFQGKTN